LFGGFGGHGEFPCGVHLHEEFRAGLIVGGAVIVGFGGGEAFKSAAGGGVVGIDAENVLVFAFGGVELAEVVVAFRGVEGAADLIDILGVLVSERRVGADRIVEVAEFAFGIGVAGIDGETPSRRMRASSYLPTLRCFMASATLASLRWAM
jgi:hypothetical protein